MPNALDNPSLLMTGFLLSLLVGGIVWLVTSRRGFSELWPWNLANLAIGSSFFLFQLRALISSNFFSGLYAGLGMLALCYFIIATESLIAGHRPWRNFIGLALLLSLLQMIPTLYFGLGWPRLALGSLLASSLCVAEVFSILRKAKAVRLRHGPYGLAVVFALGALYFALRAALLALPPLLGIPGPSAPQLEAWNTLVIIALVVSFNIALLVVLMTRLEREITAKVIELGDSRNDLQILYDAFAETAGSVELQELIPRILELLNQRLHVDTCALYLKPHDREEFVLVAQRGLSSEAIAALTGPQQATSLTGRTFADERAIVQLTADYVEGPLKEALDRLGIGIAGGFPIASRGSTLGALTVGYKKISELGEARIGLFEALALQLGTVIRAASLHEELDRANTRLGALADTDVLTGLANRRTALRALEREVGHARRSSLKIAVAMCDIDHFKIFNDEHGHDCGDYVLANTATVIMESVRQTDLAARWGGEEFLVILGSAEPQGVVALAERIRRRVESAVWAYGDKRLSVTLTIGVALCASDSSAETAISLADEALYVGKRAGRNRVVVLTSEGLPSEIVEIDPENALEETEKSGEDIVELAPLDD